MAFDRLREFFRRSPEYDSMFLASWDASASTDANFHYYSGTAMDRATFIAKRNAAPILIVNHLNAELAKKKFQGEAVVFKPGEYHKVLSAQLRGCKKLAVSKSSLTASLFENVRRSSKAKLLDASEDFYLQRAVKTEEEIACIRSASSIARRAFKDLYLRPGKTELELMRELSALIFERGGEPSFRPIIEFGPNSRFPHSEGSTRRLKSGEIILIDWGAKFKGYCSDHTRCLFLGEPNKEQETAYEKLHQIFNGLLPLIKPGMRAKALSEEYFRLLNDAGLPMPPHGLGHGIGLDVHEYPSFAMKSTDRIPAGATLALEPSAYLKSFGARFEDTIIVKKKAEVI